MLRILLKYPLETLRSGRLVLRGPLDGELLVGAMALLGLAAWWLYRRQSRAAGAMRPLPVRRARLLLGLRLAVLAVLAGLLGAPAIRVVQPRAGAVFTALLLDTSRSMSITDAPGGRPRLEAALEALTHPDPAVLDAMERIGRTVPYAFDTDARRIGIDAVASLQPDGVFTDFYRSFRTVETELNGLPVAAVVLVSDGGRNTGGSAEDAAALLAQRGIPLFVVGVGQTHRPRDREVVSVLAPSHVRRNSEVELFVTARHTGYNEPFDLRLLRGPTLLRSHRVEPVDGTDLQRIRLTFTPDHDGLGTYTVQIEPAEDEALTENNARDFAIEIRDDRLPVLYIEGSPRLEYRFLRRALFRDPDFRLVGLLRLATDRFHVQGANPDEAWLHAGFPTTAEQLFAFEAVILGDIEADFFTAEQRDLLEQFVRERGGGLLMLGGVNSFGLGGYAGTPVGEALPLAVSPVDPPYLDQTYRARLTPAGQEHPVLRLTGDADTSRRLWEQAPPLIGITPVRGPKLGSTVLLEQDVQGPSRPVLAVQHFGQGRSAAFTSGGSWYWQVSLPADNEFQERFWKQLIRWLAVGARQRLTVELDATAYARHQPVTVRAEVLERDLRPVNDAAVVARVTDPLGNTEEVPMDWVLAEEGVYQGRYEPREEGRYRLAVHIEGWDLEPPAAGFEVSEPLVEFSDARQRDDLLRNLAAMTGGRYLALEEIDALPSLVSQAARRTRTAGVEPQDHPLGDAPLWLALLVALLTVEWTLRRRGGLS